MDPGPRRRLIAVIVAGLVPWTVVLIGTELTLVFSFGLFNTNPPELLSVYSYFVRFTGRLPQFIESWGSGVLLYAVALTSAIVGVVWREDVRITALALAGTGLTQFPVFLGFNSRLNYVAVPVGSLVLLGVVWWYYLPAIRSDSATR